MLKEMIPIDTTCKTVLSADLSLVVCQLIAVLLAPISRTVQDRVIVLGVAAGELLGDVFPAHLAGESDDVVRLVVNHPQFSGDRARYCRQITDIRILNK
jgi:uncharacterized membrane protein